MLMLILYLLTSAYTAAAIFSSDKWFFLTKFFVLYFTSVCKNVSKMDLSHKKFQIYEYFDHAVKLLINTRQQQCTRKYTVYSRARTFNLISRFHVVLEI